MRRRLQAIIASHPPRELLAPGQLLLPTPGQAGKRVLVARGSSRIRSTRQYHIRVGSEARAICRPPL